ncbi:uncharacterized protein LOC108736383 isoform X2 [Agrilus planipennis]|uniref:Uncharacterized protein LOC108736383 isoform X2 n=1 Tax=Agrilus planipennis TaxID=224129 RepID=A0A1W4WK43_AGRPL|nr:uncharacterized protein LOC108736383 isoform X2 [Agrilus planipennis]
MTNAVFTEIYNPKNWIKCAFNCRKHTKTKERFWQSRKTNKKKKEVHQEYPSNTTYLSQQAKQKNSRDNNCMYKADRIITVPLPRLHTEE